MHAFRTDGCYCCCWCCHCLLISYAYTFMHHHRFDIGAYISDWIVRYIYRSVCGIKAMASRISNWLYNNWKCNRAPAPALIAVWVLVRKLNRRPCLVWIGTRRSSRWTRTSRVRTNSSGSIRTIDWWSCFIRPGHKNVSRKCWEVAVIDSISSAYRTKLCLASPICYNERWFV